MQSLIQIAGIRSVEEARSVLGAGADWIGFPLRLGYHRPDTTEEEARDIIAASGPERCVLITYETDPVQLADLIRFLGVGKLQMHADPDPGVVAEVRRHVPGLFVLKSVVVRPDSTEQQLCDVLHLWSPQANAFITDTFDPDTGACGATGRTHDWALSRRLVERSPRPVVLAGGLTADNVAEAVRQVRPAGVDAHTGVECADGRKDPVRVAAFAREARRAWAECRFRIPTKQSRYDTPVG